MPFPSVHDDHFDPFLSSKRKRQAPSISSISSPREYTVRHENASGLETTPNPKPRKQSKRVLTSATRDSNIDQRDPATPTKSISPSKALLLQSPHATNPNADYLSPLRFSNRENHTAKRRSATPIAPYEPPAEQFTPPREVLYTPSPIKAAQTISKSSKRKSVPRSVATTKAKSHAKGKKLVLVIKKEPPVIDLSLPLPPASPTDDPLLLVASPVKNRTRLRPSEITTRIRDTPPLQSTSPPPTEAEHQESESQVADIDVDLPPSSPITSDDDPPPLPVLNLEGVGATDGWSDDSTDDGFDQEGEYTGRYKTVIVPTKADPPSSCTRQRMDAWGHPKSPFPFARTPRLSSPTSPTPRKRSIRVEPELKDSIQPAAQLHISSDPAPAVEPTPRANSTSHLQKIAISSPSLHHDRESSVNPFDTSPRRTWLNSARRAWFDKTSVTASAKIHDDGSFSMLTDGLRSQDVQAQDVVMGEASSTDMLADFTPQCHVDLSEHLESTTDHRPSSSGNAVVPSDDHAAEDDEDAEGVDRELSASPEPESDNENFAEQRGSHSPSSPRHGMSLPQRLSYNTHQASTADINVVPQQEVRFTARVDNKPEIEVGDGVDEDDELNEGIIKITSDDPMAAARAAAILKMVGTLSPRSLGNSEYGPRLSSMTTIAWPALPPNGADAHPKMSIFPSRITSRVLTQASPNVARQQLAVELWEELLEIRSSFLVAH